MKECLFLLYVFSWVTMSSLCPKFVCLLLPLFILSLNYSKYKCWIHWSAMTLKRSLVVQQMPSTSTIHFAFQSKYKANKAQLKWAIRLGRNVWLVYEVQVCDIYTFSESIHVGEKTIEKQGENQRMSVRECKKYTKINIKTRKRGRESLRRVLSTSNVSIPISTISHCSLGTGQINRNTWLSKTSGNRKHRWHKQAKTCCFSTGGPCAFSHAQKLNATSKDITLHLSGFFSLLSLLPNQLFLGL